MNKKSVAIIAAVIAQVLWGTSYLLSDYALQVFSPAALTTIRIFIAAVVLGIIGFSIGAIQKMDLKDLRFILLASIAEPFIYFLCEAEALHRGVSPTVVSVMISFIPLLTPFFAWLLLRERVTVMNIIGVVLSVIGALMIILKPGDDLSASMLGIGLLIIGVLSSITYTLVLRKIPEKYNSLTIVFHVFCGSLLFFFPTALIKEWNEINALSFADQSTVLAFAAIVCLALTSSCIAFLFFSHSVRILGPTRANVFNCIPPGVTAVLCFFIKDEKLLLYQVVGIVVVVAAMIISQLELKKRK